jgi:hypothetical protein
VTAEKKKQTGRSNKNSDAPQRVVVPNTKDK